MIEQLGLDAWQLVLLGVAAVVLITMFISEEKKKCGDIGGILVFGLLKIIVSFSKSILSFGISPAFCHSLIPLCQIKVSAVIPSRLSSSKVSGPFWSTPLVE